MAEPSTDPPYGVFQHLNAPKATVYRAVLGVFVDARERFALHLKPAEILFQLSVDGNQQDGELDEHQMDQMLAQLEGWGNLTAHVDNSEVKTVEDFNKPRFLYQLSREGEAAEQALSFYREHIEQPGELQTTALGEILESVRSIQALLADQPVDDEKTYVAIRELFDRFDVLTSKAQQFMGGIQRAIDLQGADVNTFLQYKETLLDYIQRFIQQLITKGASIADVLRTMAPTTIDTVLLAAARRSLADAIDQSEEAVLRSATRWRKRWHGLGQWFVDDDARSQAALLRARARSAIPDLLSVIASLNDRRTTHSDRAADYRVLAQWFAECDSDEESHALWRSAFCLTPTRHLAVTAESLDEDRDLVTPRTSWLAAAPLWISPRLRSTGRVRKTGRVPAVIDRSEAKRLIRQRLAEETRQMEEARKLILTGEACRLSDFSVLGRQAFALFLDCLGSALARQSCSGAVVETRSSDGTLHIRLEPIENAPPARIETEEGVLVGPDHWILIEDAVVGRSA